MFVSWISALLLFFFFNCEGLTTPGTRTTFIACNKQKRFKQTFQIDNLKKRFPKTTGKKKKKDNPHIYTVYKGRKSAVHYRLRAQRVNGSYSLFHIELLWTPLGSVSCSGFCCHASDLCPWLRPAEERQTHRGGEKGRAAASVGFTVAMETVSGLPNLILMTSHARPVRSQINDSFQKPT